MIVWTKLHANQSLTTKLGTGETHYRGQTGAGPVTEYGHGLVRLIEVDEDSAGQRLDNFLMRHLKGVPKTHVYRIIRSGEVRINKGRVSAETRVQPGDVVRLPGPDFRQSG
jgi:23S rRNA pseudouridine955/2504/2580 synthase